MGSAALDMDQAWPIDGNALGCFFSILSSQVDGQPLPNVYWIARTRAAVGDW